MIQINYYANVEYNSKYLIVISMPFDETTKRIA